MVDGITRETPNAVGHIIQNCGHMAHQDQPEVITSCVKQFLASH
jgi:pimeloyl-ACP methyl ester carboxylesterase